MQKVFVDTNVLLNPKFKFEDYEKVFISITSIEEIDNLKQEDSMGYFARQATRKLMEFSNVRVKFSTKSLSHINFTFLEHKNDNIILATFKDICDIHKDCVFITDDYNLFLKANALKLPCEMFNYNGRGNGYMGYKVLDVSTDEVNQLYDDLNNNINKYKLLENQYVIINEDGKKKHQEFRYSNGKLLQLKLPASKYIKGMNSQQRCALDLLNNKNIPIKIIAGSFGSGKTYLATKMGLYHIFEKGNYGTMLLIRNPLGSGEEIGFLKGDKEDKTKYFFRCIEQYIDPSISKDKNINEYIKKDIPFYIKGLSYGSTYLLVDEAEDMDLKILKLIGSRIEEDSCVVFCGDYEQSEPKYKNNNGLYQLIEKTKGNPLVGIVVFNEDVRSEASKVFVNL